MKATRSLRTLINNVIIVKNPLRLNSGKRSDEEKNNHQLKDRDIAYGNRGKRP